MLAVLQPDAFSVPLVERLLEEGRLATLAELRARGHWLELETPATHFPAGTYPTLYSGRALADHGLYYSFQWSPKEQRLRWRDSFPGTTDVWERLAHAGKRTLVLDPYESEPPRTIEGVGLAGWQFVNVMSLNRWSVPSSARSELTRVFGPARRLDEVFGRPTVRGLLSFRRLLQESTERLAEATVHMLRRDSYDLAWVTFLAGHLGGHMLWNLSEIDPEDLTGDARHTLEGALADIYEQIDRALGRVVAALPEDADVIVTSPMGMGVNTSRVDLLPGMLEAVLGANGAKPARRGEVRSERLLWWLRASVPTSARAKVAAALRGQITREVTMRLSTLGVDWSKTPAFLLPSDHFGQVRLNIRGREREGMLDPGDVDELVDRLRAGLLTFCDPDGGPSVVAVDRVSEILGEGERVHMLPDLVVRWSERPSTGVDHVTSPTHGEVRRPGRGSGRSGAHLPEAWALLAPATSVESGKDAPHVMDIAPTICAVLGVDHESFPGSPLLVPR